MMLDELLQQMLYDGNTQMIPDNYARMNLFCLEHSFRDAQIKPYPLSHGENLFITVWDIHDGEKLTATALPSKNKFRVDYSFMPGVRTQIHSHEYFELFYVVKGTYRQRILGQEFIFFEGEAGLIDQNCVHQEIIDGTDAKIIFIGIAGVLFNDIINRGIMTERMASFVRGSIEGRKTLQQYLHFSPIEKDFSFLEECISDIICELKKNDLASGLICQGYLLRLFWILCMKYEYEVAKKKRKMTSWILLEEITEYMNQNLKDISVTMLSEKFNFQEDYFNRFIKGQTGQTYTEYLQRLRLRRAENMLVDTEKSVDDIVKEVGYRNKGYFYKIFELYHQQTPAQFRRKAKSFANSNK